MRGCQHSGGAAGDEYSRDRCVAYCDNFAPGHRSFADAVANDGGVDRAE